MSKELIKEWSWLTKVGIYENCTERIRLYADCATHREPYVRWRGNTGGYAERVRKITGHSLEALKLLASEEKSKDVDNLERVKSLIFFNA